MPCEASEVIAGLAGKGLDLHEFAAQRVGRSGAQSVVSLGRALARLFGDGREHFIRVVARECRWRENLEGDAGRREMRAEFVRQGSGIG